MFTDYYDAASYGSNIDTKIKWVRNYNKITNAQDLRKLRRLISRLNNHYDDGTMILKKQLEKKFKNQKQHRPLQTILVDVKPTIDTMTEFIYSTFDFEICKNVFYYDRQGCHIKLLKACDVVNRKTKFKIGNRPGASNQRREKYRKHNINVY